MKPASLAFVVLSPFSLAANAQSSVSVYGVLDAGVVSEKGCDDCKSTKVSSGVASGSRLGITGRESLAPDVAAVFTLEAGVLNDTGASDQNGTLFGRQAYVGLDSRLGALTFGRQYNLQYITLTDVADPFGGGMAGSAANLVGFATRRYDNTIKFESRRLHGVTASAIYSFGESVYSSDINRAYGATIGYADSMMNLRVAYQRKNNMLQASGTAPPVDLSARNTLVAANLKLGMVTAYAGYGANRGNGSTPWDASNPYGALVRAEASEDSRDTLLGLSMPVKGATMMASYIRKNDRDVANQDADQIAIGMTYAMSKRTDFYAAYAKIHNKNGAGYTVGNATEPGRGDSAVNVGVRHAF
jgi:predicted porin